MQSDNQSLWFCLAGFDLLIHSVTATVCLRVCLCMCDQSKEERDIFCNRIEPLQQFISSGMSEQIRNRNLILFFFWVCVSLVRFSLVQFGFLQQGFWIPRSQNPRVSVSVFLTLSSTASRSCPSPRSTPGSRRRTGSPRWSRDCCGHCRGGLEPGVLGQTQHFDKFSLSRIPEEDVYFMCSTVP